MVLIFLFCKEEKINADKHNSLMNLFSTIKMIKEDNKPIEIIDNLFIGSIGAAKNKQRLIDNKITHIVVAASGIKNYLPNVILL